MIVLSGHVIVTCMYYRRLNCHIIVGIPTLVFLKRDGELITTQGRGAIAQDPDGKVIFYLILIIFKNYLLCRAFHGIQNLPTC